MPRKSSSLTNSAFIPYGIRTKAAFNKTT
ncbi:hypothetical protein CCACVL1_30772 [Corchorus capsularis]|uniref:Uncharacterized protein n=1 Tax=Corchorus capsularis TaxID=210143 RepID=A0A1R3FVM4_COCAP|nr:hypothetical protein CCACVL1_30772 [Corchorus capsularis]